jgi:hypothetical protein
LASYVISQNIGTDYGQPSCISCLLDISSLGRTSTLWFTLPFNSFLSEHLPRPRLSTQGSSSGHPNLSIFSTGRAIAGIVPAFPHTHGRDPRGPQTATISSARFREPSNSHSHARKPKPHCSIQGAVIHAQKSPVFTFVSDRKPMTGCSRDW